MEVRVTVPGHTQRGGSPCAYDRVFASRLGSEAGRMILDGEYGFMVGYKHREIVKVPLEEVAGKLKMLDPKDVYKRQAIELCMYCMKTQVFKDGNKRASVIFANHYLIAQGMGFLVIPEKDVPEFKKLLVQYYEGEPLEVIGAFLKERCWKNF